jgi:hypothetical protein
MLLRIKSASNSAFADQWVARQTLAYPWGNDSGRLIQFYSARLFATDGFFLAHFRLSAPLRAEPYSRNPIRWTSLLRPPAVEIHLDATTGPVTNNSFGECCNPLRRRRLSAGQIRRARESP